MEILSLIFTICAAAGGGLFVIRLILQFVGVFDEGDFDGDMDGGDIDGGGDVDGGFDDADMGEEGLADSDVSFRFLSFQGLTAFFMMFGLGGRALLLESKVAAVWSILGAVAIGLFSVWVIAQIFKMMGKLQSSGTLDLNKAVGSQATVYLTIPSDGPGKIRLEIQGGLKVMDAVSEDKTEIKTDSIVKVVGITGDKILVVKKSE